MQLLNKIEDLEKKINSGVYIAEAESIDEWGGADVIIRTNINRNVSEWLADNPLVIGSQENGSHRRAVITKYSKELSWLFYQLRDVFSGYIDYSSKYDFFGLLADSANSFIHANNENADSKSLLKAVLKSAKERGSR